MIHQIKTLSFLVDINGVTHRVAWSELDGFTVHGVREQDVPLLLRALADVPVAQTSAKPTVVEPRIESAAAQPAPAPAAPERAPVVPRREAVHTPPTHRTAETPAPAKPELTAAEPERVAQPEPERVAQPHNTAPIEAVQLPIQANHASMDSAGNITASITKPVKDVQLPIQQLTWPQTGEEWNGVRISKSEVREAVNNAGEYVKLILEDGARVKVVRSNGMLVEALRLPGAESKPEAAPLETLAKVEEAYQPIDGREPDAKAEESSNASECPGVDFVPPDEIRRHQNASQVVRWVIEEKGIEDEQELVRICTLYREHKICDAFSRVVSMDRRVDATLRALGKKE